jgi:hypothetical protein
MILGETLMAIGTLLICLTGEESWFHHFCSETKHHRMEWNHAASLKKKVVGIVPLSGKCMGRFRGMSRGTYRLISCRERKRNAVHCVQMLQKLRHGLHDKCLMKRYIILQPYNTHPHAANLTLGKSEKFHWDVLVYPPYSPDFTSLGPQDIT